LGLGLQWDVEGSVAVEIWCCCIRHLRGIARDSQSKSLRPHHRVHMWQLVRGTAFSLSRFVVQSGIQGRTEVGDYPRLGNRTGGGVLVTTNNSPTSTFAPLLWPATTPTTV